MVVSRRALPHAAEVVVRTVSKSLVAAIAVGSVSTQAGNWALEPSVSVTETVTNNAELKQTNQKRESITELSPGIRLRGEGDRVKLNFDFRLQKYLYAQDSSRNKGTKSLGTNGLVELLDNWLFVDFDAIIAQQDISAFGGSPTSDANVNANRTETANYRVSPYMRGQLGGWAAYQLRYRESLARADSPQVADVNTGEWSAGLSSISGGSFSWSLDGGGQQVKYKNGRSTQSEYIRALLGYQPISQLKLSVFGGVERNDYASQEKERTSTPGVGFEWNPTERTRLASSRQKRFFGNSTNVSFSHRTPLSVWQISNSKDISVVPNQFTIGKVSSTYDMYFQLFASIEPDPIKRAVLVNRFLVASGISPTGVVNGGFLTSRITVQHRRDVSVGLLGASNSITFSASQTESRGLLAGANLPDDLSNNELIKQQSYAMQWSHQLSPLSSLSAMLMHQQSKGIGATPIETTTDGLSLLFSTQLSPLTRALLSMRRTLVDGASNYAESALTGTLSHQF
ncbi:TIGR03016 family PEP-CTERM system-associated outer membrane protein [Chitinimonas sp. BJB300]|uniref:TIGR03016 family PEP-CTERM system-associated outer membrane protein n=1 Tax=Chitinimonas sp. BJB300 TaxID=1559339 RepID=UPI0013040898|nr:TIGR03016 family PEP-CTERM system-associated outer membrane protein [Chitinimonas sp. BJB300]